MEKLTTMITLRLRRMIHNGSLIIMLPVAITLIWSASLSSTRSDDDTDMLAYVSDEDHLMLYDPRSRTETKLLEDVGGFVMAQDGRVAFTRLDENDLYLYIFDPSTPAQAPINISQNPFAYHYPLAWSPDGRYLAFSTYRDIFDRTLYIWDNQTTTNIMPDDMPGTADWFYVEWSKDGRLAFTIEYSWSRLDIPPEIYIWDGNTTTNLSQNQTAWDSAINWSRNGQLMFVSYHNDERGLYVWDGVSFKGGIADRDTFNRVAPHLAPTYATWIDDDVIGFTVSPEYSPSGAKEIILWDLESEAIVRQIPISSDNAWSTLAEGGQVILSSHLASGIPSVYLDIENIRGEILFSTHTGEYAWSSDGYLACCEIEGGVSRNLTIWDGTETWLVAKTSYKPAQWQQGTETFSCNNG
jgi:WD40 repeat protein